MLGTWRTLFASISTIRSCWTTRRDRSLNGSRPRRGVRRKRVTSRANFRSNSSTRRRWTWSRLPTRRSGSSRVEWRALREGFLHLTDWAHWHGWLAVVVSNGFNLYVDPILDDLGLDRVARHVGRRALRLSLAGELPQPSGHRVQEGFKLGYAAAFRMPATSSFTSVTATATCPRRRSRPWCSRAARYWSG